MNYKILITASAFFLVFAGDISAQTACPFGLANDPEPGRCARYIDQNSNAICDLSEDPELLALSDPSGQPENIHDLTTGRDLKTMTVQEAARLYGVDASQLAALLSKYLGTGVRPESEFSDLHGLGLQPNTAKDILAGLAEDTAASFSYGQPPASRAPAYRFWQVLLLVLALYFFSWFLSRTGRITLLAHRRIWNVLLLGFFLFSAISGLFLVFRVNYGWGAGWPFNLLRLHVETSLAMAAASVFHIAWHWQYYACIFKRPSRKECEKK